jgi:hypothetical protein
MADRQDRVVFCSQETVVCDSKVDVVIMLDGSGSLGPSGWAATLVMGQKLVKAFNSPAVSNPNARVAVQLFSGPRTWSQYRHCLGQPYARGLRATRRGLRWGWVWPKKKKNPDMKEDCGIEWVTPLTADTMHFTADMATTADKIKALTWPQASTFTSLALAQAQAELMYSDEMATKVVVIITDGLPINPLMTGRAANKLKDKARLIWVPVGGNAPKEQLQKWASTPVDQNVVPVEDFKILETPEVVSQIFAGVCPDAK